MNISTDSRPMRAALWVAHGQPPQVRSLPLPAVQAGHVLVKVQAVGLNPLDIKIQDGKAEHARHPMPAVLGIDMAGVITVLGEGVAGFRVGDEVFGMIGGVGGLQGALAEYVAVDAQLLARKPAMLSFREAAAVPLAFITAWEGLVDRAHVGIGKRVLVHGGAGGVGNFAIQVAKEHDAQVWATGTPGQADAIRSAGATFIDHASTPVEQYVQAHTAGEGFDIIVDTVGGATLDASFRAARAYHGHVVSALGWGTHSLAPLSFRAGTYSGIFTLLPLLTGRGRDHHGHIVRHAARMAEQGRLNVRIDPRRFVLERIQDAYALLRSGAAAGKVVVDIA